MNRQTEERALLNDVFGDAASEEMRRRTLEQGLHFVRRKRAIRRALRSTCAVIALIGLAGAFLWQSRKADVYPASNHSAASPIVQAARPKVIAGTSIRILSDEELLDIFKDRPVALVVEPGRQRLLLLDEVPN